MIYIFVVFLILILLIAILGVSIIVGRMCGLRRIEYNSEHKLEVDRVAESAVFGLLALLIAFSFSGAYERLENRKMHVLQEANAFSTAFQYVDLASDNFKAKLHEKIRNYLDLHLKIYNDIPDLVKVRANLNTAKQVQKSIWQLALEACNSNPNKSIEILLLPAIDDMFNMSETGINMARVHPPAIIFVLLIFLAASGAFMIGYNSAKNKQKAPVHMICYVLFMAFTIYIIVNIEFPRAGFIRLDYFDHILMDIRDDMGPT